MGKSESSNSSHSRSNHYYAVSIEDKKIFRSAAECAKKLKIDYSNVGKVMRGERNTVDGRHILGLDKAKVDILEYKKKTGYHLSWEDEDDC